MVTGPLTAAAARCLPSGDHDTPMTWSGIAAFQARRSLFSGVRERSIGPASHGVVVGSVRGRWVGKRETPGRVSPAPGASPAEPGRAFALPTGRARALPTGGTRQGREVARGSGE